MLFAPFGTRLAKAALPPVSLMVCLLLSCTARRDGRCSGFAHGVFAAIVLWLAGTAIVLVLLMACLPSFRVRLAGTGIASYPGSQRAW